MQLDIRKTPNFKGYSALLSGNNDPENKGDLQEGFEIGWEELNPDDQENKRIDNGVMAGANVWPSQAPSFREGVLKYQYVYPSNCVDLTWMDLI